MNLLFPLYNLLTAHADTDFRFVCSVTVPTKANIHTGVHTVKSERVGQFCCLDISQVVYGFFCDQGQSGVRVPLTRTFQLQVVSLAECGLWWVQGKDDLWEIWGKSEHKSYKSDFLFALSMKVWNMKILHQHSSSSLEIFKA